MGNIKFLDAEKYSFEITKELAEKIQQTISRITNELGNGITKGHFSIIPTIKGYKVVFNTMIDESF